MSNDILKPNFKYIDSLRGYAILLVIACHSAAHYKLLPYPAKILFQSGWHGVQLFFIASCVTLLMSWDYERKKYGVNSARGFFIRRFFRIAPAYYAAGIFYFFMTNEDISFDIMQMLASYLFINAWSPDWIPTVDNRWLVVPGGWSIGVEFTFYFLFPVLAVTITSLKRGILCLVLSVLAAALINDFVGSILSEHYQKGSLENFLYFWFPNQFPVFSFGICAFFLIKTLQENQHWIAGVIFRNGTLISGMIISLVALLPYSGYFGLFNLNHYISISGSVVTEHFIKSFLFFGLIVTFSLSGYNFFINNTVSAIGRVSFSAYILHFYVLQAIFEDFELDAGQNMEGIIAVPAFAFGFLATVLVTYILALASYRVIELPMINYAKTFIAKR